MRPSWTATTDAVGMLRRSTCWRMLAAACARLELASAAAIAGDGGAVEPGVAVFADVAAAALADTATALPVALAGRRVMGGSAVHATCLPVTGRRESTRPVNA